MRNRFHRSYPSNRQGESVSPAISSITDTFGCNLNSVGFLSDAGFNKGLTEMPTCWQTCANMLAHFFSDGGMANQKGVDL